MIRIILITIAHTQKIYIIVYDDDVDDDDENDGDNNNDNKKVIMIIRTPTPSTIAIATIVTVPPQSPKRETQRHLSFRMKLEWPSCLCNPSALLWLRRARKARFSRN